MRPGLIITAPQQCFVETKTTRELRWTFFFQAAGGENGRRDETDANKVFV